MRLFLALLLICGSVALAHGASLDRPKDNQIARDEPCRVQVASARRPKPAAPIRMSRSSALYVIRHVHKACRILAGADADRSRSSSIRADLYESIVRPIYRIHPSVAAASSKPFTPRALHATSQDIGRSTAQRLNNEFARLQRDISKLGQDSVRQSADESTAKAALEIFLDATAELGFAGHIAFDAYPDLFAKSFDDVSAQPRTAESDAGFRKAAPPIGSVKLSDAALTLIQSFMREIHRSSRRDQVAVIFWAHDRRSKGPGDAAWSGQGSGWTLGSYERTQIPPDVIDTVRDVEIVFSAEDPSALAGKTIDATKQKLFVRD
ncbi:hypothetical protein NLM16_33220 [Bradyrhizobium brasilense]|uniref:hypothetical protein n=1 Tax=Bradyrhizobium brasilense TaxID=1419277 RepID=UPI002877E9D7|nr:hypothetical protein [Bradyrhizobium brasilense]MCP3418980.1 hypothetical protein [Bradyrhizobium brasilense]